MPNKAMPSNELQSGVGKPRPEAVFFYHWILDKTGHKYGPKSPEMRKELQEIDKQIQNLTAHQKFDPEFDHKSKLVVPTQSETTLRHIISSWTLQNRFMKLSSLIESDCLDAIFFVQWSSPTRLNIDCRFRCWRTMSMPDLYQ